jgi:beta-phosphoglucomutase
MIKAVIFDLDGVLVTTDELHFKAWSSLAEELGIKGFTKSDNARQRGVSRMASLEILLEKTDRQFTDEEKEELAERKNEMYIRSISKLSKSDLLPEAVEFIDYIKSKGIKTAIGSASKNTPLILKKTEISDKFDAISCGLDTVRAKPEPDVFLIAAKKLGIAPECCAVIEDSDAGIRAAKSGGMYAIAVGAAEHNPEADVSVASIESLYKAITLLA